MTPVKPALANAPETGSAAPIGLRERGKLERMQRIRDAARAVFRDKGYDAATTREIASLAGVASGTLFLYARDKRDLLLLIVNDDLDALTEASFIDVDPSRSLLDQLTDVFAQRYAFWAREPNLSTAVLHETVQAHVPRSDTEAARFTARRSRIVTKIAELVDRKQQAGDVRGDVEPATVAWMFMALYIAEVRIWLAGDDADVRTGVDRLRTLLALAAGGVLLEA